MEGLGAEVSAKIRSAIKAKLIELEAYVDEELPDYIMVMVANNRNKDQMEDDLGLFLNNNTKAFTNWLHAVLEKLKKVTLDEVSKKESKKKKIKKTSEKSGSNKPSKDIKEKKSKSDKKAAKSSSSKTEKSSKNANLEELGDRKKKKSSTSVALDDSGGKGDYDPAELLKSAVDKSKSKTTPKKSSSRKSGETRSSERKSRNMINLREEEDFYRSHGGDRGERERRGGLVSIVSKVVRPDRERERERDRARDRERDREWERERYPGRRARSRSDSGGGVARSVVSRAEVPPRPSRPPGREERGVARAVSRAMVEADRSIVMRGREEDRERVARLSAEDVRRYEFLTRRREEREEREMRELRDVRQRERDLRDRQREEEVRLRHRRHRDEQTDEAGPLMARARLRSPEISPPKKRKLEDDDAELLEMRRKALESLMKRTDKELVRTRVDSGDRKIVENISSDSSDSDSELSLSELDTSKEPEPEPTFIVTMDGIDENYFNGDMKPQPKAVMRRKAEKIAGSGASSDGELELHADVNFDDGDSKKTSRTKPRETAEKPTMKVAARKRSPILPPTAAETKKVVAAVKPLPKNQSKSVNAAKLAASYAAKLSEIKASKAKLKVSSEPEGSLEKNISAGKVISADKAPLRKTISVDKSKLTSQAAPMVKLQPAAAVKTDTKTVVSAKPKRVPIKAPSPERSSPSGVSKLSYGNSVPTGTSPTICKFWPQCTRKDSCIFKHPPKPTPTTNAFAGNSNKYKWKAGI